MSLVPVAYDEFYQFFWESINFHQLTSDSSTYNVQRHNHPLARGSLSLLPAGNQVIACDESLASSLIISVNPQEKRVSP